jgi:AcrR family transcriptional regulator
MAESTEDPRVIRTRNDVLTAAVRVLVEDGWDEVTHSRLAKEAGYSRATLYAHWPDQIDLLRDAFSRYGAMPHHEPSGDPETDLRGEVESFCRAMVEYRLDRALATLAERAQTTPEVLPIRDAFVSEGERPMRQTMPALAQGAAAEAAVQMLCGMVTHSVLMHGTPPPQDVIDAAVDIVIAGLAQQ